MQFEMRKEHLMDRAQIARLSRTFDSIKQDADGYFDSAKAEIGGSIGRDTQETASDAAADSLWQALSPRLQANSRDLVSRVESACREFAGLTGGSELAKLGLVNAGKALRLALELSEELSDGGAGASSTPVRKLRQLDRAKSDFSAILSSLKDDLNRPDEREKRTWNDHWLKRSSVLTLFTLGIFIAAYGLEQVSWRPFPAAPEESHVAQVEVTAVGTDATRTAPAATSDVKTEAHQVVPGKTTVHEEKRLERFLTLSAFLATLIATIWAIQTYWRLRLIDELDKKWRPPASRDLLSGPFTFHYLAQSHKEWAQLWFSWCIAIFMGGLSYAMQSASHASGNSPELTWPGVVSDLFTKQLHHAFIFALFGFCWYWASRHYRSHWHNYIVNAYRHRALFRFETLRDEIWGKVEGKKLGAYEAQRTILELYRLSGVLLLEPIDSAYSRTPVHDDAHKKMAQMEDITEVFNGEPKGRG